MKNLGTIAAALTAAILIGNMASMPVLRPLAFRLLGLIFAIGLVLGVFLYCSRAYNPFVGWLAAALTLVLSLSVLGVMT